ncbi:MAG: DUF2911 domain-containing protein [Saprospiraceae bacterium]|nr:DUF2911 domain-containing protein [Saprospiraceae bacterium]
MKKLLSLCTFAVLLTFTVNAQIKTPQPSPLAKISQEVGLSKVDVEYSRPSAKGRKIFGELVPFGEMWRTGANASTKVTFGDDVKIGGTTVTKGTYALYVTPNMKDWSVIFYKNTSFWGVPGKDFNEADVAAKVTVPVTTLAENVESFTINVDNLRNSSFDLVIEWEKSRVSVPVMMDTDTKVMADIKSQMEGPSASTYYQSARYYYEEKKDMNMALAWVQMALDKGGEKFWIVRQKALILAELGRYKDAIATAERSTELAKAEGNGDYPRMNDKSIAEWKSKK